MRNASLLLSLIATAAPSAACGHDEMDMMSDHAAELETHLEATDSEMTDHHARMEALASLGEARAEEDAHMERMAAHAGGMMHEMGDMAGCMDEGSDGMSAMFVDVDRLRAEREEHATRMADAASLVEVRAEEARHQERMSALVGELRDHMESVMGDRADQGCPHHG